MSGSKQAVFREVGALYRLGVLGDQPDSALLRRFLSGPAESSEAAFETLVRRHGPMVLGVCRRMRPSSLDADDVFQAVFLVLARRASRLLRHENLAGWLHETAVRTAREAARREARLKARERRAALMKPTEARPHEPLDDELAALDEELNRLPARSRDAILLCDLEGRTRAEAARLLGIAEGTLSSRLARARARLRERLQRRGIAPSVPLLTARAGLSVSESLAVSTARLAARNLSGPLAAASVSSVVESLTRGVLKTMLLTKLKTGISLVLAVGLSTALAAGAALAIVSDGAQNDDKAESPRTNPPAKEPKNVTNPHDPIARGVVVDEQGEPVPGAEVEALAFALNRSTGRTDAEGRFAIPVHWRDLRGLVVLASSAEGTRLGFSALPGAFEPTAPSESIRVVLRPSEEVSVSVTNADGQPVEGASVETLADGRSIALTRTNEQGRAVLHLPAEAPVQWILGLKSGAGFDYAEFGFNRQSTLARDLPDSVRLVLDGARVAHVKAVDREGQPVEGIKYYAWLVHKPDKADMANLSGSQLIQATTGADGVATFDWLPTRTSNSVIIMMDEEHYHAPERAVLGANQPSGTTLVSNVLKAGMLRGRATHPDGSPASGVKVVAEGRGAGLNDHHRKETHTAADGSYSLEVPSEAAYAVAVEDERWGASGSSLFVHEAQEIGGLDFSLVPAATIQGRLTRGPERKPAGKEYVNLTLQEADPFPRVPKVEGAPSPIPFAVGLHRDTWTDESGHYAFHVGPGKYVLKGPDDLAPRTVEVAEGQTLNVDLDAGKAESEEKGPVSGRVVLATDPDAGVAGALIEGISNDSLLHSDFHARTDDDGRFRAERYLDKMEVLARSPDNALAGIVTISGDDREITIPVSPSASASGVALDEDGKPLANELLLCGTAVTTGESFSFRFGPSVSTDAEGRFSAPGLVVGRGYVLALRPERRTGPEHQFLTLTAVTPEKPGPIDLGRLKLGDYQPPEQDLFSSFLPDAPDAGDRAPALHASTLDGKPLSLDDFKGKYLLIDFWATWCGPCIAEIPHLEAVYEAFGDDKRFAMLSLSVDETIDEPRAFQDKRKLPWNQGFVGERKNELFPREFGVRAIPALVLIGPDGKIVARGMRGEDILKTVRKALEVP